jgi:hypothetical protein
VHPDQGGDALGVEEAHARDVDYHLSRRLREGLDQRGLDLVTPSGVTSPGPTVVLSPEAYEASPPLYCRRPARQRLGFGVALVAVGVGGLIVAAIRLRKGSGWLSPA